MSHMPRERSERRCDDDDETLCENYVANDHKLNVEHGKMEMARRKILKLWIMMHSLGNILV